MGCFVSGPSRNLWVRTERADPLVASRAYPATTVRPSDWIVELKTG